jgi:hypothetical protein
MEKLQNVQQCFVGVQSASRRLQTSQDSLTSAGSGGQFSLIPRQGCFARMEEPIDFTVTDEPASARDLHSLGSDRHITITLPDDLSADFSDHEFTLPSPSVCSFSIVLPRWLALVRLRAITLETLPRRPFPVWQCTRQTRFQGVVQPHSSQHWLVGDALAVPVTPNDRNLLIHPGPLPAAPRLLRLSLAAERLSAGLADALTKFLRRRAENAVWEKKIAEHEARELAELIAWPQREPSELLAEREQQLARQAAALCAKDAALLAMEQALRRMRQSRSWRLTAPFRQGGEWVRRVLRGG